MNVFNDVSALQLQPSILLNLKPETIVLHDNSLSDCPIMENNYKSNVKNINENSKFENCSLFSSFIQISPNGERTLCHKTPNPNDENTNMDHITETNFSFCNINVAANLPCVEWPLFNTDFCQEPLKESPSNNDVYGHCDKSAYMCKICGHEFFNQVAFDKHIEMHAIETPIEYDMCQASYYQADKLVKHMSSLVHNPKTDQNIKCNQEFSDLAALDEHGQNHTSETTIHYDVCQTSFHRVDELVRHRSIHVSKPKKEINPEIPKKELTCEKCSKKFSDIRSFISHMYTHTGLKPYICELCPRAFMTMQGLNYHIKSHTRNQYICQSCNQEFSDQADLDKHIQICADETHAKKPYICKSCKQDFCDQRAFFKHMKMHGGEKAIDCDICQSSFYRVDELIAHMSTHANTFKRRKLYKCKLCSQEFCYEMAFFKHMEKHTGEKPIDRDICHASFYRTNELVTHMATHTDTLKKNKHEFTCEICLKKFSSKTFISHKYTHTSQKPYMCKLCKKAFTLLHHNTKTHSNRVPNVSKKSEQFKRKKQLNTSIHSMVFLCEKCNKTFRSKSSFYRHLKLHTESKTFICGMCDMIFTDKSDLIVHTKTHRIKKQFSCEICLKYFNTNASLKQHMRLHTGEKLFV